MSKQILFRAQARKKEGRLELNKKHVPIDWVYGSVVHQNSNKKFADIYPQTSENEKSRFTQILSANTPERMTDMVTKFLKTTSLHSWHISVDEKFRAKGSFFTTKSLHPIWLHLL